MPVRKLPKTRERIKITEFNTPLSINDRTSRQQISKLTSDFKNINQFNLNDISKTEHQMTAEHIFFSSVLTQNILQNRLYSQPQSKFH